MYVMFLLIVTSPDGLEDERVIYKSFPDQEEEPLYCRYEAGPDPTAD